MGRTLAVAAAIAALFANTAEAGRVAEHAAHYQAPQKTEAVTVSLYKPLMAELAPQNGHYEAPPCASDEQSVQIQGVSGDFCSPQCDTPGGSCPTDVPAGTTATPQCALVVGGGSAPTYCALICQDGNTCPDGATCQNVQVSLGATPLRGLRPQNLTRRRAARAFRPLRAASSIADPLHPHTHLSNRPPAIDPPFSSPASASARTAAKHSSARVPAWQQIQQEPGPCGAHVLHERIN